MLGPKDGGAMSDTTRQPRIVLVVPRGEAVRNFLYSRTLDALAEEAEVTLLSVVSDEQFSERFADRVARIVPLEEHRQPRAVGYLRVLTENAHDRWLWSEVAKNNWRLRDERAREKGAWLQRRLVKATTRLLANNPTLQLLTALEQGLAYRLRPTRDFDRLFAEIEPDLVFNGSHIHGLAGELPLRVAHRRGIPTAGFIFSWDNLTSRSRIFVPYDHYLVWHQDMQDQLLSIYSQLRAAQVTVTGTPQLDFHFDPRLELPREELCRRLGLDPGRPYVLYTTGIANHFYDEHEHVAEVIRILAEMELSPKPQLVVRTYVKGTSPEMYALAEEGHPDVIFPEVLWEPRWQTPRYEDLEIYSNLLRHAAVGINAASTVSLELMIFDKPIINLGFDPPESGLPWDKGYERHILFDHYRPVAESGAVGVARSNQDLAELLHRGLTDPGADADARRWFLEQTFGDTLDGCSAERVAETLLRLAREGRP